MTPRLVNFAACMMLILLSACKLDNEALRTEVLSAVMPDSTCSYSASNATYTIGYYDPTVDGGKGYQLAVLMRNNLQKAADDVVQSGEIANINGRSRDVQITSFDACWYPLSMVDDYGSKAHGGQMVDCDTIPNQSARIPVFGRIDEGGQVGVVQATVLDLVALRSLFGDSYAPLAIPNLGRFVFDDPSTNPQVANGNQTTSVRNAYAFGTEDPANLSGRSAAWGAKYPAQRDVVVVVQMRANMQMQTGEQLQSNWFSMPITVCTGCLQDYCGPLVEKVCARGPCADGTECLNTGLCSNTTLTCAPISLYSGARPDFYGQSGVPSCMPAQSFTTTTPLTCTPVGCNAQN